MSRRASVANLIRRASTSFRKTKTKNRSAVSVNPDRPDAAGSVMTMHHRAGTGPHNAMKRLSRRFSNRSKATPSDVVIEQQPLDSRRSSAADFIIRTSSRLSWRRPSPYPSPTPGVRSVGTSAQETTVRNSKGASFASLKRRLSRRSCRSTHSAAATSASSSTSPARLQYGSQSATDSLKRNLRNGKCSRRTSFLNLRRRLSRRRSYMDPTLNEQSQRQGNSLSTTESRTTGFLKSTASRRMERKSDSGTAAAPSAVVTDSETQPLLGNSELLTRQEGRVERKVAKQGRQSIRARKREEKATRLHKFRAEKERIKTTPLDELDRQRRARCGEEPFRPIDEELHEGLERHEAEIRGIWTMSLEELRRHSAERERRQAALKEAQCDRRRKEKEARRRDRRVNKVTAQSRAGTQPGRDQQPNVLPPFEKRAEADTARSSNTQQPRSSSTGVFQQRIRGSIDSLGKFLPHASNPAHYTDRMDYEPRGATKA